MDRNPRFYVRAAQDRPGFAIIERDAAVPVIGVRPTREAAQQRADELNEKASKRDSSE